MKIIKWLLILFAAGILAILTALYFVGRQSLKEELPSKSAKNSIEEAPAQKLSEAQKIPLDFDGYKIGESFVNKGYKDKAFQDLGDGVFFAGLDKPLEDIPLSSFAKPIMGAHNELLGPENLIITIGGDNKIIGMERTYFTKDIQKFRDAISPKLGIKCKPSNAYDLGCGYETDNVRVYVKPYQGYYSMQSTAGYVSLGILDLQKSREDKQRATQEEVKNLKL